MSLRRASSVRATKLAFCDEDDEEDGCQSILRRHQSLPTKRKNVHFADSFGKPLVFSYSEEEYNIHVSLAQVKKELQKAKKSLKICFQQPASLEGFRERLERDYVCLENVAIQSESSLIGTVKVKNIAYHKEIIVRYTLDSWITYTDVGATYVLDSNDGNSDRFSFAVALPEYFLAAGGNLELAICYRTGGQEYWDNNGGINYRIESVVNEPEARFRALTNGY